MRVCVCVLLLLFCIQFSYAVYFLNSFFVNVYSRRFAEAVGCDDIYSLKACAKKKSVQEILSAQNKVLSMPNLLAFAPVVDGYLLPGIYLKMPYRLLYHVYLNRKKIYKTECIKTAIQRLYLNRRSFSVLPVHAGIRRSFYLLVNSTLRYHTIPYHTIPYHILCLDQKFLSSIS